MPKFLSIKSTAQQSLLRLDDIECIRLETNSKKLAIYLKHQAIGQYYETALAGKIAYNGIEKLLRGYESSYEDTQWGLITIIDLET